MAVLYVKFFGLFCEFFFILGLFKMDSFLDYLIEKEKIVVCLNVVIIFLNLFLLVVEVGCKNLFFILKG